MTGHQCEAPVLSRPLEQWRVNCGFGPRTIAGCAEHHPGIDLRAAAGTPVYAAADGIVIDSRNGDAAARAAGKKSYGERIFILHNGGWVTLYAHLSRRRVRTGQHVERGQVIGYAGNTGRSYGPHLHFELRPAVERAGVDPLPFFEPER